MVIGAASSAVPSTLLGLTRFHTNTMENVASFSDTNILALINIHYREIQAFILSNIMNQWKENTVDGTGTGLINLVAGTSKYALATDLMSLDRVEINYSGETNGYQKASIIKMGAVEDGVSNISNYNTRAGGNVVWERSNYLELGSIPSKAVTSGMKVYYTNLVTDLTIGTNAAATPKFNAAFHQLLAMMTASDWLKSNDQASKADRIDRDVLVMKDALLDFYSSRDADDSISIQPKYINYK